MKIFIDIGHPAHVHYFRNFIQIMENKGHFFFISARDKDVTHKLLDYYGLKFTSRGRGRSGLFGKLTYLLFADVKLFNLAKKFNPDLFMSFSSSYAAHVSKVLKKPHIAFDDTEHAKYEHMMYVPFTDTILTPTCFNKSFGEKQIYFNSYMELSYLHPNRFQVKRDIKNIMGLGSNDNYVILRFVSWSASHDIGHKGLNDTTKIKLIDLLSKNYKVFISSEGDIPEKFEKYKLKIHPSDLHSVLANASLYIGEGSTTASECSVLGVPNIFVNSLTVGYCKEQQDKYKLCYHLKDDKEIADLIKFLLAKKNSREEWKNKKEKMLRDKIDLTAFMVWFVENYTESFYIMKKNPDYQYNFR